ncbi:MAG: FAD:protein FMN transferase [Novosphingobium sp.]
MGTDWRVRLALPPQRDPAPLATAIQHRLDGIVAEMSHWQAGSLLSRYNAAPAGSWTALPSDFAAVIAAALAIAAASDGAFDPALGRLTDAWGLGPNPSSGAPTNAVLLAGRAASGWRRLAFDREAARLRQPGGLWLDLSGIAKGYAADAVADTLAGLGVRHALVEIGGECVGRGLRPDRDPWWVELETPAGFALPPLRVALHQLAVATSGDYERGGHTLDPATGCPPIDGATAVSVLHPSCMIADAWASALGVLAPDKAIALAERHALAARLLTRTGEELVTTALRRML